MGKFGKKNHVSLNPLDANICLLGTPKVGKEQPVSEPVLTETGWKPMGEIVVGDKVYGEDGELYNVTGVFPQGVKDVYEVTFRDGTSTRCGLEHLWRVSTKKQRENERKAGDERYKILELSEILKDYKNFLITPDRKIGGHFTYKYSIPIAKAIKFKENEHKLSPMALGLLLGDGGFASSVVTFTNSEDELFETLEKEISSLGVTLAIREFDNHKQANIVKTKDVEQKSNPLRDILKELSLDKCGSREKFIPREYLYDSVENRLKLLSGIINTDGHVTDLGTWIAVSTYSKRMADDVAELARGLGFVASLNEYDRTNEDSTDKYDNEIEYRVSIIGDDFSALDLSSKHKAKLQPKDIAYVKSITNIVYVGKEECQCIMIDNPNHLYITKDFIVTHNTTIMKQVAERLVGDDGYLFLEMYRENGAKYIENIVYENVPDWATFTEIIDDICDNKTTDYPDLKVVFIDTIDNAILLAEQESIRLWNKENPSKRVTSISAAWNGFMKGQDKAMDLFQEQLFRLREVGVAFSLIGHIRTSTITDPVSMETYQQLTSDISQRYFNQLKKNIDLVGVAYVDREIVKQKVGDKNPVTHQEKVVNKVSEESRKIKFRDSNYSIDSGGRMSSIAEEIPFDADAFIKAMKDALEAEVKKGGVSIADREKEQIANEKAFEEEVAKKEEEKREEKNLQSYVDKILQYAADKKASGDIDSLKILAKTMKENGVNNPKEIDSVETAKAILGELL